MWFLLTARPLLFHTWMPMVIMLWTNILLIETSYAFKDCNLLIVYFYNAKVHFSIRAFSLPTLISYVKYTILFWMTFISSMLDSVLLITVQCLIKEEHNDNDDNIEEYDDFYIEENVKDTSIQQIAKDQGELKVWFSFLFLEVRMCKWTHLLTRKSWRQFFHNDIFNIKAK